MNCRICGNAVPVGRRTICSKACEAEYNRRCNRAGHYRRKGQDVPEKKRVHAPPVALPAGNAFRCIYDGPDNDTIPAFHIMSREAVRDFVGYGAPVDWFEVVR